MAAGQRTTQQRIAVKRVAPDFTAFTGLWSGKSRSLVIGGDGVVTETVYDDAGKLVVQLTYQLGYPEKKNDTSSADTTITKVKVGQRKLLKGRVPRVGAEGTLTITKGIVRPPYLNTTYCDAPKSKKGVCGK